MKLVKSLNKIKLSLILAITSLNLLLLGGPVMAATSDPIQNAIQSGVNSAAGNTGATVNAETKVNTTIANIVNVLSMIIGIIAVIMIIIAGFRYVSSGGNSDKITSAKNTLVYAIVGLVIVAVAQIIVRFVLKQAT